MLLLSSEISDSTETDIRITKTNEHGLKNQNEEQKNESPY